MKLTPNQLMAIETLSSDVSISAGAGSGKTAVLVRRFCKIVVDNHADVDEILTVTFTEKAANEMKQRIAQEFERLYESTGELRYESARRKVESAYIGTIHSFASRLLKENLFEASIDPSFTLIDEATSGSQQLRILDGIISESYQDPDSAVYSLVRAFGMKNVRETISKLDSHLCSLGKRADSYYPKTTLQADPNDYINTFEAHINTLKDFLYNGKLTPAFKKHLEAFLPLFANIITDMKAFANNLTDYDPKEYTKNFNWDSYESIKKAENFVNGTAGSNEQKQLYIKPAKEAASNFCRLVISPIADYYISCFLTLTQMFHDLYKAEKDKNGYLDFDDLLSIAVSILLDENNSPSPVAESMRKKFKFVMIDEFQDTNLLQKSIIQSVTNPDSFFTVGDVKQAIYSFMHSDVSIFIDHHNLVKNNPAKTDISLQHNYRSRPGIISFVNWFFAELWRSENEFEFEELISAGEFFERDGADIELVLLEDQRNSAINRFNEAKAIAARVNKLLGRDGNVPFQITKKKDNSETSDVKPGDILILLRSTTDILIYSRALADAGIEHYIVSGRGYYDTHEVQDIVQLLKVVDNPLNDIAMAAVLRSPLVAISDDTLWLLTREYSHVGDYSDEDTPKRSREIGKLYKAILESSNINGISENDKKTLVSFLDTLTHLQALQPDAQLLTILDMAIERTSYDLKLLASEDGRRKYANLRKLINLADTFQQNISASVADFINYMDELSTYAGREGEAPTETEYSDVVRLMTVHKSKGLQAPVVIVADSSRDIKKGDSSPLIFDPVLGPACKVPSPIDSTLSSTAHYDMVQDKLTQKDISESMRLLYVAATRAEELLIISGVYDYKDRLVNKDYREISSWAKWFAKALNITSPVDEESSIIKAGTIDVLLNCPQPQTQENIEAQNTVFDIYLDTILGSKQIQTTQQNIDLPYMKAINKTDETVSLTVSSLLDYETCPYKYYLKHVLGVPEEYVEDKDYDPLDTSLSSSAEIGTAVHQILGLLDFTKDYKAQVLDLSKALDDAIKDKAVSLCLSFENSIWHKNISAGGCWLKEAPFYLKLENLELHGRLDLLYKTSEGWIIADYKTGAKITKNRYQSQIGLYALAVDKCIGQMPAQVALIGIGNDEYYSEIITKQILQETEKRLIEVSEKIANLDFCVPAQTNCKYCSYSNLICKKTVDLDN